ncbi:MAG TPA: MlaD family protein [bacterium]|nr:MlaD family protein [bacterium]
MTIYAKIGIFLTVCTVLVSIYIYKASDTFTGGKTRVLYALADDAMGLLNDSDILTAGVVVGKLTKIELEKGKAKLTLEISTKVDVFENASIEKVMESMLGTNVLVLNPGNDTTVKLNEFDYIKNVNTASGMSDAMDKATIMMEKATEMISIVTGAENQGKLNKMIDILSRTTENTAQTFEGSMKLLMITLKNMSEITHKINVKSEVEMDKLSKILENTVQLTDRMNSLMKDKDTEVSESLTALRDSLKLISEELKASRGAMQNLRNISEDVNQITDKVAKGEGNVGKILNDDKLYKDLTKISDKLADYADSVLGMQVHVDAHSDYMVFDNAFKTYFDITLQPRADRFYTFGVVDDPRGRITESSTTYELGVNDGTTTDNYIITENKTKKDTELKFNLQIGRNFGPMAFRGGIFQNKVGLAIDYNPWKFLSFSAEIFDFGGDYPELRIKGLARPLVWTIEPLSWIYLTVGGEDLIAGERDLFFGFGLRFTDNDLKTIISSVPIKP